MPAAEQHAAFDRYLLVPRTLIFLRRGEMVLLLRGAPHKKRWANRYNGVGGHLEPGESIFAGALREVREETGLEPETLTLAGTLVVDTGANPGVLVFVLAGEAPSGEPIPSPEGTLEWVHPAQVRSLPTVEDLPVLLERLSQQKPGDPPFTGLSHYNAAGQLVVTFDE